MLGSILPYELAPLAEVQQPPVSACEVWFVEENEELVTTTSPHYLLPDLAIQAADVH